MLHRGQHAQRDAYHHAYQRGAGSQRHRYREAGHNGLEHALAAEPAIAEAAVAKIPNILRVADRKGLIVA